MFNDAMEWVQNNWNVAYPMITGLPGVIACVVPVVRWVYCFVRDFRKAPPPPPLSEETALIVANVKKARRSMHDKGRLVYQGVEFTANGAVYVKHNGNDTAVPLEPHETEAVQNAYNGRILEINDADAMELRQAAAVGSKIDTRKPPPGACPSVPVKGE